MSIVDAILSTSPTSYWPLDDVSGTSCHDELGLQDAILPPQGVTLAAIPFGAAQAPSFDGASGSFLVIGSQPQYSQPYLNALSVAAWLCPLALDNTETAGSEDQYVHYVEKAVSAASDAEWALRFYNQTNPSRHSRLSFYTFNLGPRTGGDKGNGSYMEYGRSRNDATPVELGKWIFVVGQAEPWISPTDASTGCVLWKQDVAAERIEADKYFDYQVQPQAALGPIRVGGTQETAFKGAIAHLAIWNRLLTAAEIASIWTAGQNDLSGAAT